MNGDGDLNQEAHREAVTTLPIPKDDASVHVTEYFLFYQERGVIQDLFSISELLIVN